LLTEIFSVPGPVPGGEHGFAAAATTFAEVQIHQTLVHQAFRQKSPLGNTSRFIAS
jgi:hypothetical protein